MKDFGSTIDELRGYFERMTEAERVANAQAIAGQRGYNGLLAILNATEADYTSLTDSINNCTGAAQRMAAVKLDNMNGQLTLMQSAWDALKTTIGEEFLPEMRGLYEVGTDVLTDVNAFLQANPGLIKGIAAGAAVIGGVTMALTAYSAGAKVAAAASLFLSASIPGVNVILGVTAAVAGVVGVVTALTDAANEGVPSVKELSAAAQEMGAAMAEAGDTFEQTASKTMATAEAAGLYIDKLEEIEAATGGNIAENQEYHNILALLTRAIPELTDCIDLENNVIEGGTEALRQRTDAWKKNAEAQAYQEYLNSLYDDYNAVMVESIENNIKLTQAQLKLENAEKKWDAALTRMHELSQEAIQNGTVLTGEYYELESSIAGYRDEMYQAERTIDNLNKAIAADAEAVAAAEAEFESARGAVDRLTGAVQGQSEAASIAAAQSRELQDAIGSTAEQVAALAEAYGDAYEAALGSVQGQYNLWDKAAEVVATSVWSINSALESQITYWQGYNANLDSLSARTGDIEGLAEVIASFADGSTDSVNAVAGLSRASDEDLRAMVENWRELQKEQEAAAGSVADLKTGFTSAMDELQAALAEDIREMDLGAEAIEAGRATIQGYISAANEMLPLVQNAYEDLGKAAINAMGPLPYSDSAWAANRGPNKYAAGTQSAAPGLALVGEEGPELVYFGGGEKVLNATQTAALQVQAIPATPSAPAAGGSPAPSIQVVIQISGNATPETVSALQEYGDDFAARVLEVIEDARADVERKAY